MINNNDKIDLRIKFVKFIYNKSTNERFESNILNYKLYDIVYDIRNKKNKLNQKYIIVGSYYTLNKYYKNYSYRLKEINSDKIISSNHIKLV